MTSEQTFNPSTWSVAGTGPVYFRSSSACRVPSLIEHYCVVWPGKRRRGSGLQMRREGVTCESPNRVCIPSRDEGFSESGMWWIWEVDGGNLNCKNVGGWVCGRSPSNSFQTCINLCSHLLCMFFFIWSLNCTALMIRRTLSLAIDVHV